MQEWKSGRMRERKSPRVGALRVIWELRNAEDIEGVSMQELNFGCQKEWKQSYAFIVSHNQVLQADDSIYQSTLCSCISDSIHTNYKFGSTARALVSIILEIRLLQLSYSKLRSNQTSEI